MTIYLWCRLKNNLVYIYLHVFFILFFFPALGTNIYAATNSAVLIDDPDFPTYPAIKHNVEFWIDVFTKYSNSQGVIHDSRNLDIIYDIIKLDNSHTLRARRKNRKKIKAVVKKYKNILLKISKEEKFLSQKEAQKIAAFFGPDAKPKAFKDAAYNIRCQTGLKQEFKKGLQRSGAVIDEFKRIFRYHGLPVDLIYLPCVESSYNFKAYSKFGAAGIWQFTRSTGKQYMKIDYAVDERRDPYISTNAAARLLKKNYASLKEWSMALTAYNHGLAGMRRAKKSKGSYENIVKSYRSRSFKFASRNFYSEFLAARVVAKNPEKYFGSIKYYKPVKFQVIKTKGYLSVKQVSEQLNIKIDKIKTLNPALRKPVFNEQKYIPKGYNLKLPEDLPIQNFNTTLAKLYKLKQKPSRFHRVRRGDTAGSIARIHSVKLSELKLANNMNRRATIYIGQNLRIPVTNDVPVTIVKLGKIAKKDKKFIAKTEKLITQNSTSKAKGDKAKIDEERINKTPEQEIKKSAKPLFEAIAKPAKDNIPINPDIVIANLNFLRTFSKDGNLIGVIRVEPEETLGHYADWLQIPTQKIRVLNKFAYGKHISVDQKIKLPIKTKTIQKFEEQRYEFHKEIEEDFFESFVIQSLETYEVKNGDSIWNICLNKLEIPVWLLKKFNADIHFNSLHPKQIIRYPVVDIIETD